MKECVYDLLNGGLDRAGFADRRERLVAGLKGDVLEIGAGTGLDIAHYRAARCVQPLLAIPRWVTRGYGRSLSTQCSWKTLSRRRA